MLALPFSLASLYFLLCVPCSPANNSEFITSWSTFKFAFFPKFSEAQKGKMLTLNIHFHVRIIPLKLFIALWVYFLILLQNKQISKILELMIAFSLTFFSFWPYILCCLGKVSNHWIRWKSKPNNLQKWINC